MKLLFDENLSHRLVQLLSLEFPGSEHVREAGLNSADDSAIWSYAESSGFVIVSKDSDFQQRAFLYGFPPKVVWLRIGNSPTNNIATLLRSRMSELLAFETDPTSSLLILS